MTLRDIFLAIWLSKLSDALTPVSGNALKPFCFAASRSASKSWPAPARSCFALSSWNQPFAGVWSAPPFLLSARYCVPVQLDSTTFQPSSSEEGSVGKECVRHCRSRWLQYTKQKQQHKQT